MDKRPKNKIRRLSVLLILAVLTMCMLLAGCQTPDKSRDSADLTRLEEIQERGVLKVGATGDYQPMSYLDPETDEYFFRYIEPDDALAPAA